ncbi:hypothetical protein M426DRAFT_322867 [Hypoxylon sp. CI-4A]|nr:hypothetical protein M426DRAFT_322867 [Hypoxylon sp. CI-4A]
MQTPPIRHDSPLSSAFLKMPPLGYRSVSTYSHHPIWPQEHQRAAPLRRPPATYKPAREDGEQGVRFPKSTRRVARRGSQAQSSHHAKQARRPKLGSATSSQQDTGVPVETKKRGRDNTGVELPPVKKITIKLPAALPPPSHSQGTQVSQEASSQITSTHHEDFDDDETQSSSNEDEPIERVRSSKSTEQTTTVRTTRSNQYGASNGVNRSGGSTDHMGPTLRTLEGIETRRIGESNDIDRCSSATLGRGSSVTLGRSSPSLRLDNTVVHNTRNTISQHQYKDAFTQSDIPPKELSRVQSESKAPTQNSPPTPATGLATSRGVSKEKIVMHETPESQSSRIMGVMFEQHEKGMNGFIKSRLLSGDIDNLESAILFGMLAREEDMLVDKAIENLRPSEGQAPHHPGREDIYEADR